jgi:hypothetical protein
LMLWRWVFHQEPKSLLMFTDVSNAQLLLTTFTFHQFTFEAVYYNFTVATCLHNRGRTRFICQM